MTVRIHPSIHGHPGEWLRTEIIDAHGLNVAEAAKLLDVAEHALDALLSGQDGLSRDMALCFERAFGVRAETLMRMQAAYGRW